MKTLFSKKAVKLLSSMALGVMLLGMIAPIASAAILFQDDTFETVESDAIQIGSNDAGVRNTSIQFGNDPTASENGNIQWNITTNRFSADHSLDVTGDLTTTNGMSVTGGQVDFHSASGQRLRESSNPNGLAACATLNEVIVDTTSKSIKLCTTTGIAGAAVWTAPSPSVPTGASNPGTCAVGDLFFNTTTSTLNVCTATNTFSVAGPQDFESVYNKDADKTLTTSGGNFTVAAGAGNISNTGATFGVTTTGATTVSAGASSSFTTSSGNLGLTATTGNVNVTGGSAASNAVNLSASNAAGGITGTWGTGGLNFSSATGAFTITGTGNSTETTANGNLTLGTTGATGGNLALSTTGTGKSITFADANVTTPIKFSNTATSLAATYAAGDGILDALNELTSTAAGNGASNIGVNNTFTNITGSDVQAALASIDGQIGHNGPNVENLTFNPQFPNFVISKSGSNNNGTLTEDFDSTNNRQLYDWTTNQVTQQGIDVKTRFPLPTDFVSTGNFTFDFRTGTITTTNNKVTVTFKDITKSNTVCATSANNASANAWTTITVTAATLNAGCAAGNTMAAGDIIEVDTNLFDISNVTAPGTFADVGTLTLGYNN